MARNPIIEGPYLHDLLAQPSALRNTVAGLAIDEALQRVTRDLQAGAFQRVVLTGMGGSFHALHPLHLALTNCGISSVMAQTSELVYHLNGLLAPRPLVVAVSQSGRSIEMVRLIERLGQDSVAIGLTNQPDSPLGTRANARLLMQAGAESTVTCKTYLATLVLLEWLAKILTAPRSPDGNEQRPAPVGQPSRLSQTSEGAGNVQRVPEQPAASDKFCAAGESGMGETTAWTGWTGGTAILQEESDAAGPVLQELRADLQQAPIAVEQYLADWREKVAQLIALMEGVEHVFVVGRGRSLATAGTAGLILKESAHFPAEGMSSAAFRHGPFEMLDSRIFVLVMEGDAVSGPLNRRLVDDVQKAGGRAALVSPESEAEVFRLPTGPSVLLPVLEILPVQMLSLALAARTGREAGKFHLATKVTTLE